MMAGTGSVDGSEIRRENHLGFIKTLGNNGISTTNLNWFSRRISGCHQQ